MTAVPSDENQFLLRDRRCKEFTTEGPCSLKFILLFLCCVVQLASRSSGRLDSGKRAYDLGRLLVNPSRLLPSDCSAFERTSSSRLRVLINQSAYSK